MIDRYRPKSGQGGDYEVGYGRPPVHSQFKPKQSGNPKGRPKGTRNLENDLADELAERVAITEGGRKRKISKQRAILKSLMMKALKGDVRASETLLKLLERHQPGGEIRAVQPLPSEDRAILERFLERNASRAGGPAERDPEEDPDNAG